jgi:formylglycine-generating enzyme required for sulfatase activity
MKYDIMKRKIMKKHKMINMKQVYLLLVASLLFISQTMANNLVISGTPSYSSANQTLTFTMAWDNSWCINAGPTNWDAVWIFVKRQNCSGTNNWVHQKLSTTSGDHLAKLASNSATSTDVQVDAVSDGMGVFVRRIGTNVVGNVVSQIVTIKLAGTNPSITTSNTDNFEVIGVEMVYVPQGQFYIGDGRATNSTNFSAGTTTQPVLVTSTIQTNGIGSAINYTSSTAYGCPVPLPSTFPLGFNGFYCMKYEATIGVFAEFVNSLTYDQQTSHLVEVGGGSNLPNVTGAYFDCGNCWAMWTKVSTPGTYNTVAAVFTPQFPYQVEGNLSWKTAAAFLDWSGLRPMTEFEFEKACRGPLTPVANEYPWGSTTINMVQVGSNYSDPNANSGIVEGPCFYGGWDGSPQRPGAFAKSTTNRTQSGATYYGIMDMAGNVSEQCIGGSGYDYSGFTNSNGDGVLSATGYANTTGWPSAGGNNSGTTTRGGWMNSNNVIYQQTSDRSYYNGDSRNASRNKYMGARGVRTY